MKGVIVEVGAQKTIVLFNNGKLGTIPTRSHFQVGAVVSHTKKSHISRWVSVAAAMLFVTGSVTAYAWPVGTVEVSESVALTYNCFKRVIGVSGCHGTTAPLNDALDVQHHSIETAYQRTLVHMDKTGALGDTVSIIVAQDSLAGASDMESKLLSLSGDVSNTLNQPFAVHTQVCTRAKYANMSEIQTSNELATPAAQLPFATSTTLPTQSNHQKCQHHAQQGHQ